MLLFLGLGVSACKSSSRKGGGSTPPPVAADISKNPTECAGETEVLPLAPVTNLNNLETRAVRVRQMDFRNAVLPAIEIEVENPLGRADERTRDFVHYRVCPANRFKGGRCPVGSASGILRWSRERGQNSYVYGYEQAMPNVSGTYRVSAVSCVWADRKPAKLAAGGQHYVAMPQLPTKEEPLQTTNGPTPLLSSTRPPRMPR